MKNDLRIAVEIGDRGGEGEPMEISVAHDSMGDYRKAIEYHEKHLKIAIEIGDQGEGGAYGSLSNAHQSLGDYQKAIEYLENCLRIAKEIGNRSKKVHLFIRWKCNFFLNNSKVRSIILFPL